MNSSTVRAARIALLGDNIATSLSPAIHRVEAAELRLAGFGYDAVDLAQVPASHDRLGDIISALLARGYTGFNVTHPYKQTVLKCLDGLSSTAQAVGAVNVVASQDGKLIGHNTDQSGLLAALRRNVPDSAPRGDVLLLGAGGAGSAAAGALCAFGASTLRIIDPDEIRLAQLATRLQGHAGPGVRILTGTPVQAGRWAAAGDAVVNATPVGMEQLPGTPLQARWLRAQHWVADVIYRPVHTELLRAARELGCPTVDGTGMFIEQAAETFALLTGVEPDRARMRSHLRSVLYTAGAAAS